MQGLRDLFLWSILGNYGKGKFLDNIEPTMYRIHDDGIFSTKTPKQKNEMWLRTCLSLFTYYIKNFRLKFAFYFFFKSIQSCIFKITYKLDFVCFYISNNMIGVVILNYNSYVDSIKLVTELQKQTVNKDLQIVVVDNSSTNNSYQKLKALKKNLFKCSRIKDKFKFRICKG